MDIITNEYHICTECLGSFKKDEMLFTTDCHGIPFRHVCYKCYTKLMSEKGYDGEYYTEADECLDEDY